MHADEINEGNDTCVICINIKSFDIESEVAMGWMVTVDLNL